MTTQYVLSKKRVVDANGNPLGGAKLYVYEAGTTTPLNTYSDSALSVANSNPIVADSSGLFGNIFLGADDYKFILRDSDDIDEWTQDDYEVIASVTYGGGLELVDGVVRIASTFNSQTSTAYTVLSSDRAATIAFSNVNPITVTLPAADSVNFPDGWYAWFDNRNRGQVTIQSTSQVDGQSSIVLNRNEGVRITSNGVAYFTSRGQPKENYFQDGGELTIASGAVSAGEFTYYIIDTEANAATDDLDTINVPLDGKILVLAAANGARDVVVKHNTGNIYNPSQSDLTLDDEFKNITLRYEADLSKWVVIGKSGLDSPPTVQVFTASGTWTRPAGVVKVKAIPVAGGGGGGGAGAASTSGANGGNSSFGALVTATGGSGAAAAGATVEGAGGAGGAGGGGDIDYTGQSGGNGILDLSPTVVNVGGDGGSSGYGYGGRGLSDGSGANGVGYGSGGAGGAINAGASSAAAGGGGGGGSSSKFIDVKALASETITVGAGGAGGAGGGGDGTDGIVIVEEYYG